ADRQATAGVFLLAGQMTDKGPNGFTRGAIVARAESRAALMRILHQDPLYGLGLVQFDVHEFTPRRGFLRRSRENPLYLTDEQYRRQFAPAAPGPAHD